MDRLDEKVDNNIEKFKEGRMPISDLLHSLFDGTGKTMIEVLEICQKRLGGLYDEDLFFDEALPIVVDAMPKGGYIDDQGFTVIYGSEETF